MSTTLHARRDDALELIAILETRHKDLVKRCVRAITEPRPDVKELADCLRECCAYQIPAREIAHRQAAYFEAQIAMVESLNVKALAAALRPHLAVLAEPDDGIAYYTAVCSVRDIIAITPPGRLTGGGMKAALGPGRHRLLMDLIDVPGTAQAKSTSTTGRAGGEAQGTADPPRSPLPRPLLAEAAVA